MSIMDPVVLTTLAVALFVVVLQPRLRSMMMYVAAGTGMVFVALAFVIVTNTLGRLQQ